jgi:two-component system, NarL family, invasion response regulator UvrY
MRRRLRILIVDDHPIVRRGLRELLLDTPDVADVGEAASPQEVLDRTRSRPWDVVILDLGLPGRGGLDVLQDLKREHPALPVLVLSMQPEDQYAVRAFRSGAAGYLTKEAAPERLLEAIHKVTAGGRYVTPAVAEQLAADLTLGAPQAPHHGLSNREFEVLRLIASGKTVGDIAAQLSLSVKTISSYRTRILDKMRMSNNAELMQYALRNGLVE